MELNIRAIGLHPTPAFKHYVERRLRHGLRSFAIDHVTVRLIRDHGRGRRTAHCCQVAVASQGLELLRVNETHNSICVACVRAANKTRRMLVRLLHRARRPSRAERGATIWHDTGVADSPRRGPRTGSIPVP
jgi:ribosome-associated translation inhibitor RaiA